jgi:aminoglycoside phosphotransferase (APT) family kinase protein
VRLGSPVVESVTQPKGFSPGLAARLKLADGRRVFIKAVSEKANPDSPGIHRREAQILAALPASAPVPRLLWTYDEDGWVALCLEDIDGRHPVEPWADSELDLVLEALKGLARSLTPSPITTDQTAADAFARMINGWQAALARGEERLDEWCIRNLDRLARLEAQAPDSARGETLLNFDVRADNLLIAGERVYVLDWPWARTGAWWIDIVCMLPSVAMQGGPSPAEILSRVDMSGVRRQSVDAVVCALAGYFVVRSLEPPPPGLPTVRAFQAAQGRPAIAWLRGRTGWD